jgi:hypothetical protein
MAFSFDSVVDDLLVAGSQQGAQGRPHRSRKASVSATLWTLSLLVKQSNSHLNFDVAGVGITMGSKAGAVMLAPRRDHASISATDLVRCLETLVADSLLSLMADNNRSWQDLPIYAPTMGKTCA